jgi:hypothetical protein
MGRLGVVIGGFVLALGLAYGLGLALNAVRRAGEPVVCPEAPLADRLAGHVSGLACVQVPEHGARLVGARPDGEATAPATGD